MIITKAKAEIITPCIDDEQAIAIAREDVYLEIERAARTCYKSEVPVDLKRQDKFIRGLVNAQHFAMIEHGSATVRFTVDRGVSHEIVRHRIASFAQESTRYCNYGDDKFGNNVTFIRPCFLEEGTPKYELWRDAMKFAEAAYMQMLEYGATPQEARSLLPNSVKTEVVMKADMTEWRHFFRLRAIGATGKPHPQMQEVAVPLLKRFSEIWPAIFYDLDIEAFQKGVYKEHGI